MTGVGIIEGKFFIGEAYQNRPWSAYCTLVRYPSVTCQSLSFSFSFSICHQYQPCFQTHKIGEHRYLERGSSLRPKQIDNDDETESDNDFKAR
jgi:hypothetical protein